MNKHPPFPFSEVKTWKECPYRHKLVYIDKIDVFKPSPYLDFGTTVHSGCETILESGNLDKKKLDFLLSLGRESPDETGIRFLYRFCTGDKQSHGTQDAIITKK